MGQHHSLRATVESLREIRNAEGLKKEKPVSFNDFVLSVRHLLLAFLMAKHLVISTSENPDSNSRRMGQKAFAHLQKKKIDCDWIDIREMELPLCDADKCYGMPDSKKSVLPLKAPME